MVVNSYIIISFYKLQFLWGNCFLNIKQASPPSEKSFSFIFGCVYHANAYTLERSMLIIRIHFVLSYVNFVNWPEVKKTKPKKKWKWTDDGVQQGKFLSLNNSRSRDRYIQLYAQNLWWKIRQTGFLHAEMSTPSVVGIWYSFGWIRELVTDSISFSGVSLYWS